MNAKELKSELKKIIAECESSLQDCEESASKIDPTHNKYAFIYGWHQTTFKNLIHQLNNISK